MFRTTTARLRNDVETLKHVLDTLDSFRDLVFSPDPSGDVTGSAATAGNTPMASSEQTDRWLYEIRDNAPSKASWKVYDHCAAFTRLYAIYEQFIEELISDYLRILPDLYDKYEDLPDGLTRQHRIGTGQILFKLGKDGPYKHLDEKQVITGLAQALLGGPNYKLLRDAFLIEPHNYRSEVVTRLFGYIGIGDCWRWIEKNAIVVEFMDSARDKTERPATVLNEFVQYRNEAAHTSVGETVATEEIKAIADCVTVICEALAQLVMMQVVRREEALGRASIAGEVIHRFDGRIAGMRMRAGTIAVGDELVVVQKFACYKTEVQSIRIGPIPYDNLDVNENQEIGVRLSVAVRKGALLMRVPVSRPTIPLERPSERISPDELQSTESVEGAPDPDTL